MDAFTKVVKVTNHNGLWDAELAWYSPRIAHQICFYGLEYGLIIHGFRPTWPYPSVEVLVTWAKFLEPSGYCITVLSPFCSTNVFVSFCCCIMAQFEFIKQKLPNLTILMFLCSLQITHGVKQDTMCQCVPTIMNMFHRLNYFSQAIDTTQISMYFQNIVKLFTHSNIKKIISTFFLLIKYW